VSPSTPIFLLHHCSDLSKKQRKFVIIHQNLDQLIKELVEDGEACFNEEMTKRKQELAKQKQNWLDKSYTGPSSTDS
jgi:hypothetical protein